MNRHVKTLVFVIMLGAITSGTLLGMDYWTADYIAANEEYQVRSAVLDAYGISYTPGNVHDVYEERVEEIVIESNGVSYTFYVDREHGNVSFGFEGGGVWGPITGMLSLEDDWVTIRQVRVLSQSETPGLGGVVAERDYLAQYVGVVFDEENGINVTHSPEGDDSEVDAITGGTRTSNAFQTILNDTYFDYKDVWETYMNEGDAS